MSEHLLLSPSGCCADSGQEHKILPVTLEAQLSHHSRPLPIGYFCCGMCQPLRFSWGTGAHVTLPVHSAPPSVSCCVWGVPRVLRLEPAWVDKCPMSMHILKHVSPCVPLATGGLRDTNTCMQPGCRRWDLKSLRYGGTCL